MRVWPGDPAPLGATFDGLGTNIAVFSNVADAIEICVFDGDGNGECVELPERSGAVFHGYFPDMESGARYGLRVHGPHDPRAGHRCDPSKLLIDPYARAIDGYIDWDPAVFAYDFADPAQRNQDDSAAFVPKSVVVNPYFDWAGDTALRHQWADTVIYEAHVKGATMTHPDVPEDLRGTYAGIADPAFVDHLTSLGVTALELLPVHHFVHEQHLLDRGLRNYWGYHTIGYFAPHHAYSSRGTHGQQVHEFKQMVKTLHTAGIEVILDVVYNHTAEGNEKGPTLSMRGIDNAAYYRLVADDPQYYMDYTGTGNTLNMRDAYVLQLVMDSLRYWATEMHVDGFRFDLASALARSLHEVDRLSAFFDLVQQDPVVSRLKLIAEPWDIGEGGYQVGNFPAQWAEWNGRYRDCIRDHWAGNSPGLGEFAYRITGSSDLYEAAGRRPHASINFVTAHDGFTLRDLVSYNEKHNEANGEDGHDGESHNRSWNCGAEGPTDDPEITALALAPAAQPPVDAAAVAGRADDPRRRRARPHPAGQQQRLLPGQRDLVVRLVRRRRRSARVHPPARPLPPRAQGVPPSPVLPGARAARRRGRRHRLVQPQRGADERHRLGRRQRTGAGAVPLRRPPGDRRSGQ